MQFGINVVPSNLSSYAYYQKLMEQQIKAVKRFAPQADILVVGVSDMANRFDGELKSNPSVEKVLQAQRKAALGNGALFWDGYSAMGGEGSIIEWVNSKPPLATKDYTHFTNYGAKRFGQKMANALLMALGNNNLSNNNQTTAFPDSVSYE
jgi:lysophospholipase L1-like esterase